MKEENNDSKENMLEVEKPNKIIESDICQEELIQYKKQFLTKLVSFFIFFALVIIIELFYRERLFEYSLTFEKEWQNKMGIENSFTLYFFNFITNFGTALGFMIILCIFFIFFKLPIAFNYLFGFSIVAFITNYFKGIYKSDRPYWRDPSMKTHCDGGYGNPSGHSSSSAFMYLALWNVLCEIEIIKGSIILKIVLLLVCVGFAITIILSRLFLAMHGVNQVIYGSTIGLSFYFLFYHVINCNNLRLIKYSEIFTDIKYIIGISAFFLLLIILMLINYYATDYSEETYKHLIEVCDYLKPFRRLKEDWLFGCVNFVMAIGAYYGQIFFWKVINNKYPGKEESIKDWNKGLFRILFQSLRNILTFIGIIGISLLTFIFYVIIPDSAPFGLIYAIKVGLSFSLPIFLIFGPALYFIIKLNLANEEIYKVGLSQLEEGLNKENTSMTTI
ncbi:MAG: phosphatase PAP2 family protein [archaeon]|nr:phosphatase PAP2 family protein [archaeon]